MGPKSFCELFWLQMKDKCSYLGARLAALLRWSHLGANFVYLGAHNDANWDQLG